MSSNIKEDDVANKFNINEIYEKEEAFYKDVTSEGKLSGGKGRRILDREYYALVYHRDTLNDLLSTEDRSIYDEFVKRLTPLDRGKQYMILSALKADLKCVMIEGKFRQFDVEIKGDTLQYKEVAELIKAKEKELKALERIDKIRKNKERALERNKARLEEQTKEAIQDQEAILANAKKNVYKLTAKRARLEGETTGTEVVTEEAKGNVEDMTRRVSTVDLTRDRRTLSRLERPPVGNPTDDPMKGQGVSDGAVRPWMVQ